MRNPIILKKSVIPKAQELPLRVKNNTDKRKSCNKKYPQIFAGVKIFFLFPDT
jgi:hypothetical protein